MTADRRQLAAPAAAAATAASGASGRGQSLYWTAGMQGCLERVNHAAVVIGAFVYSFGGFSGSRAHHLRERRRIDVQCLNVHSLRWTDVTSATRCYAAGSPDAELPEEPLLRYGHTVVQFAGCAFMFGGRNDREVAPPQICQFDPVRLAWTVHSGTGQPPQSRDGHSACVIGSQMYVFGGFTAAEEYDNHVYCCDLRTVHWTRINAGLNGSPDVPSPRDFSCTVAWGRGFFLWGGRSDAAGHVFSGQSRYDPSVYYFDTYTESWSRRATIDSQLGRRSGTMFCLRDRIYFGFGFNDLRTQNDDGHMNDLWCLDPCSGSVTRVEPCEIYCRGPCPRRRLVAVPVSDSRVILFGGTCRFLRYTFEPALSAADFHRLYAPLLARLPALRAAADAAAADAADSDGTHQQQESGPPDEADDDMQQIEEEPDDSVMGLKDLSDMFVLEFQPSLQTLCSLTAVRCRLPLNGLPVLLQEDVLRRILPSSAAALDSPRVLDSESESSIHL